MLTLSLICAAVAMLANWSTQVRPHLLLETISKPVATIMVIWVAVAVDGPRTATILAVVGLAFCLVGDIALLKVVDKFIAGLGDRGRSSAGCARRDDRKANPLGRGDQPASTQGARVRLSRGHLEHDGGGGDDGALVDHRWRDRVRHQ